MRAHDVVAYRDRVKRRLFGDMEVVQTIPNNRVDVRKVPDPNRPHEATMIWSEYVSDLEPAKKPLEA